MIRQLFAAVALTGAMPVMAQSVTLTPGEMVTVSVDGTRVSERGRTAAEPSAFESAVLRAQLGGAYADAYGAKAATLTGDGLPPADPIPPGSARIRLIAIPKAHGQLLVIENGYGGAFAYRAYITRGGKRSYTDVCTVLPGKRGFEHWPEPFDKLELSAIRIEQWREGQQPRCE